LESGDDAEIEARSSQFEDEPILSHSLCPGSDIADCVGWVEDAIVAMFEGSQRRHTLTLSPRSRRTLISN
jgi:hypothetical protein